MRGTLRCLALSGVLAIAPRAGLAQAPAATIESLTSFFAGRWECEGKFANGSPIAADVAFESVLGGRWLSYTHTDRPPTGFQMRAMWGIDPATHAFVSAATDNGGGLRLFRASGWVDGAISFERAVLGDSLARPERFIYRRESDSTFRMTWEVRRGAATWVMGDYVLCARQ